MLTVAALKRMLQAGRGVLLIAHERERAAAMALEGPCDIAFRQVKDERGFNTVLLTPQLDALRDVWRDIVLLDGDALPGEVQAIMMRCPRATLHSLGPNPNFTALLRDIALEDESLRVLYRRVRQGSSLAAPQLAEDCGLTLPQVLTGLTAFQQVKLAEVSLEPYAVKLLPPVKCRMDDSRLVRYLRALREES